MAIHKLHLDEFDEIDYSLIAIHTALEDFRLAYLINKILPINLSKSKDEIIIENKKNVAFFSKFQFDDSTKNMRWNLVQNKNEIVFQGNNSIGNLFENTTLEYITNVFLLPEFKKVDFFLKIDNSENSLDIEKTTFLLNTIDSVLAVYTISPDKIKNKNNLIF